MHAGTKAHRANGHVNGGNYDGDGNDAGSSGDCHGHGDGDADAADAILYAAADCRRHRQAPRAAESKGCIRNCKGSDADAGDGPGQRLAMQCKANQSKAKQTQQHNTTQHTSVELNQIKDVVHLISRSFKKF
jgi:hypothetical protein